MEGGREEVYYAVASAFYGGGLDDFARERTGERLTWRRRII